MWRMKSWWSGALIVVLAMSAVPVAAQETTVPAPSQFRRELHETIGMVRSIVTGRSIDGFNVVDRTNVTADQASAPRVQSDSFNYTRLGYGSVFGNHSYGGPALAPLQQRSRQRSWAGRHPVLLGALAGAGIGVGAGVFKCDLADKKVDFPCKSIFGLQGAVVGGLVGLIAWR